MKADLETIHIFAQDFRRLIEDGYLLDYSDGFEDRIKCRKNCWAYLKTTKNTKAFCNGLIFEIRFGWEDGDFRIAILHSPVGEYVNTNMADAIQNLESELQKFVAFNISYFVEKHNEFR